MKLKYALIFNLAMCFTLPAMSQTCKPDSIPMTGMEEQFVDNDDGTVTDIVAGLIWQKCSQGQTFENGGCVGTPTNFATWQEALSAAKVSYESNGYRMPNIKELNTLVERSCIAPAINLKYFPATPSSPYWSNTVRMTLNAEFDSNIAFVIDFSNGVEFVVDPDTPKFLRLVKPMVAD